MDERGYGREDEGFREKKAVLQSAFTALWLLGQHNTVENCLRASEGGSEGQTSSRTTHRTTTLMMSMHALVKHAFYSEQ